MLTTEQPNQRALAHRVAAVADLAGVVVSGNLRPGTGSPRGLRQTMRRVARGVANAPLRRAWAGTQEYYAMLYPELPSVARWEVDEVNERGTFAAVESADADLVLVSGTNLLRQRLIDASNEQSKHGTMNLHTGLSPYVRGGPNSTNWCLATSQPWLIGNTVMWIDAGIDSGAIITTECTPIDGSESLEELHRKVIDHAHDLTLRALHAVAVGEGTHFTQSAFGESGSLYLTKDWNARHMAKAWLFHRARFSAAVGRASFRDARAGLQLVPIVTPADAGPEGGRPS